MHNGQGNGASPRFPRLVPLPLHEVARCATDRKRSSPTARKVKPKRSADVLPLGDSTLLRMDMGAASRHFQVERLIGRRDRKSGAKKRTQEEIEAELRAAD